MKSYGMRTKIENLDRLIWPGDTITATLAGVLAAVNANPRRAGYINTIGEANQSNDAFNRAKQAFAHLPRRQAKKLAVRLTRYRMRHIRQVEQMSPKVKYARKALAQMGFSRLEIEEQLVKIFY